MPSPCHKIHYDSLPYDPDKRPCHICKKPVYDFRDKNEAYLNKIWKMHQGDFCGAFRHNQFTSTLTIRKEFISLGNFRNVVAGFILSCWSLVSMAQDNSNAAKPHSEVLTTDNTKESSDSTFMIMTKQCITCEDEVRIDLYINHVYFRGYRVNDSTIISLPSTIKPTDTITVEAKDVWNNGWSKSVDKVEKVEFKFGDRKYIELKGKSYNVIRFSYKRDWIGCPSNFW